MGGKKQLVVLAAGLGRRFGGDKQITSVGPKGQWLLDYALYDAALAGFTEAILVVRPEMAALETRNYPLPVRLAFQENNGRQRPWGTAHALWSARGFLKGPFGLVNADDWYGRDTYYQMAQFLEQENKFLGLVGFPLASTLSEHGGVSRGLIHLNEKEQVVDLLETKGLERRGAEIGYENDDQQWQLVDPGVSVSMNAWALRPEFVRYLDNYLPEQMDEWEDDPEKEFYLPDWVMQFSREKKVPLACLPTRGKWMGVTFRPDLHLVKERIGQLIQIGTYPNDLTDPEVPIAVFRAFFPKEQLETIQALTAGHIHRSWQVKTEEEVWVAQRLHQAVFSSPEDLQTNADLIANHLQKGDYPFRLLRFRSTERGRKLLILKEEDYWRMLAFWPRSETKQQLQDLKTVERIAEALGTWHHALLELDPRKLRPVLPRFFDLDFRWDQWKRAKEGAIPERLQAAKDEIQQLESGRGQVRVFQQWKNNGQLPLRILHGDPKLSNLLFERNTESLLGWIDWDTVQAGWLLFDYGELVRSYACSAQEDSIDLEHVSIDLNRLQAIQTGFIKSTQAWITSEEEASLSLGGSWVLWMQALRFLADYLVGDIYYQTDYPEQNLHRARTQLQLWLDYRKKTELD
jgi:Ser/Thr protein kinase RdoA (MazF antagonist)